MPPLHLPPQAPSCCLVWLLAVPGVRNLLGGQLWGWKAGFSQLGAGSSSCASWKVTCDLKTLVSGDGWFFFFHGLVTQPLLVLKEEPR